MGVREKLRRLVKEAIHSWEPDVNMSDHIVDNLITHGVTGQEWISVADRLPEKDGQYLIFTTQYFTPDHIDEIDHKDVVEISGYCKDFGFLSRNSLYAKYWTTMPQPPKGE